MSRLLDTQDFIRDKLAWQLRALCDPNLSTAAKACAGLMMHDLNVSQGGAWRGQESMADKIGVCARQVRRALAELKAAGYLQIEVGKGRGRTNVYRAILPDQDGEPGSPPENRTPVSSQTEQKRTSVSSQKPENRTSEAGKQDAHVLQFLEEPFNPPYPPKRDRRRDQPKSPIANAPLFLDRQVRQLVVSVGGEGAAASYLDPARWDAVSRSVVCRSPTAHSRLRERFSKALGEIGVSIVLDASRHQQLPCPTFSDRAAA